MPSNITAPSGLELSAAPPKPVRVSKRAVMAVATLLAFLTVVVFYGAYKRNKQQRQAGVAAGESKAASALSAAKNLTRELTAGELRPKSGSDLQGSASPSSSISQLKPKEELTPPPLEPLSNSKSVPTLPGHSVYADGGGAYHEETAEEKRRLLAYQLEVQARNAPSLVQSNGASVSAATAGSSPKTDLDLLTQAVHQRSAAGSNPAPLQDAIINALRGQTTPAPQQQASEDGTEKEQFLEKARSRRQADYLNSTRVAALSPYEIKAGWDLPAVLEQALNSDLPGDIRAMVRSDVYDSATGHYLLIPQGAKLVGNYNSNVSYGQDGLQVVWTRLIFPDGSSLDLDGMNGLDVKGATGLRADVDHHYRRLFGTALLTSLFSAGLSVSQNRGQQNALLTPSAGQLASEAVAQQVTQMGIEITRKNLNVAPTIKIPMGYRFNVRVNRDILLDRPYIRDTPDQIRERTAKLDTKD
jgi:type IV secretory pathway VirB10-like protein